MGYFYAVSIQRNPAEQTILVGYLIPKKLRNLLDIAVGDVLDIHYSKEDKANILKRSDSNGAICGLCKDEEQHARFRGLNFCRWCAEEVADLVLD